MMLHPEDSTLYSQHCETLKSCILKKVTYTNQPVFNKHLKYILHVTEDMFYLQFSAHGKRINFSDNNHLQVLLVISSLLLNLIY